MKKLIPLLVVGFLILSGFGAVGFTVNNDNYNQIEEQSDLEYKSLSLTETMMISEPNIILKDDYVTLDIKEATSTLLITGEPQIPVITKTFTFPAGTIIDNADIIIDWEEISLTKKIMPSPAPEPLTSEPVTFVNERKEIDDTVYSSTAMYPSESYTIRTGSGLKDGEHVLYYNVRCYSQYSPANNLIKVPKKIDINIEYSEPIVPLFSANTYDFLIITDNKFKDKMQELADYRNNQGIKTIVVTTDEIYPNYNGVADWEDIKLFLADVVKDWGVDYVLLAGGHKGQTNEWYIPEFLSHNFDGAYAGNGVAYDETYASDLYYADVYRYDQYGHAIMDDWDSNGNGIYAEGPYYNSIDIPDYYPDVYLGRIPLRYSWEADIIVDKIKEYDTNINPSWFYKCVVAGGDTSPPARDEHGNCDPGVYEGEIVCDLIASRLKSTGFSSTKLYTSNNGDIQVTSSDDVIPVISQGCGWLAMQTHSNPATCGNFFPEAPTEANFTHFFTIFDVKNFDNDGMYPFFTLDGCHSGQFNATMQQVVDAGSIDFPRSYFLEWAPTDMCSWALLQEGGGSIGTVGVSALGYGYINDYIIEGLGGWIMPRFAHAYAVQGLETTGEIWVQGITDYINIIDAINTDEIDRKTIEERVFLGDPTVILGGALQTLPADSSEDEDTYDNEQFEKPSFDATSIADVPSWNEGQEWTFKIYDFDFSFHEVEGRDIDIHLTAGDLNLIVEDVTGDTCSLKLAIDNVDGSFDIHFDPYTGEEPKVITFEFPQSTAIQGNIYFEKSSLAIGKVELTLDLVFDTQELLDSLGFELPPLLQKFIPETIPVTANLILEFDHPFTLIQFPLNSDSGWGIEQTKITIDGTIESKYFRILKIINNILGIFGIDLIPPELAKYLPVIDISEVLTDFEIPAEIEIPGLEQFFRKPLFLVDKIQQINVGAGSFNAYDIQIVQGVGDLYYSDEAEMIVKFDLNLNDYCPILNNLELELISMSN